MTRLDIYLVAKLASVVLLGIQVSRAASIPSDFISRGADRQAISSLLENYTRAVNTRNKKLFESLLLDTKVPFSGISGRERVSAASDVTHDYETFAREVFTGPPFHQDFQDVHILQDGALASVTLVFIDTGSDGKSWGWKTLQLLKIEGTWKIISEFYTGHELH